MKQKKLLTAKNFNAVLAKEAGKEKFVKDHLHLGLKEELEAVYDKIVPPKAKTETK